MDYLLECFMVLPGVEATYEGANADPGHLVNGDPGLHNGFDHPDVGAASGSTPAQNKAHRLASKSSSQPKVEILVLCNHFKPCQLDSSWEAISIWAVLIRLQEIVLWQATEFYNVSEKIIYRQRSE